MAKITEQTVVIKLSKLVRDDDVDTSCMITDDMIQSIEESVQNLVSDIIIVEVERN